MIHYQGIRRGFHVFKVKYENDLYKVTFSKHGEFDNLGYYYYPKRENFDTEEEFLLAEGVDAGVFLGVMEIVENYIDENGFI